MPLHTTMKNTGIKEVNRSWNNTFGAVAGATGQQEKKRNPTFMAYHVPIEVHERQRWWKIPNIGNPFIYFYRVMMAMNQVVSVPQMSGAQGCRPYRWRYEVNYLLRNKDPDDMIRRVARVMGRDDIARRNGFTLEQRAEEISLATLTWILQGGDPDINMVNHNPGHWREHHVNNAAPKLSYNVVKQLYGILIEWAFAPV